MKKTQETQGYSQSTEISKNALSAKNPVIPVFFDIPNRKGFIWTTELLKKKGYVPREIEEIQAFLAEDYYERTDTKT